MLLLLYFLSEIIMRPWFLHPADVYSNVSLPASSWICKWWWSWSLIYYESRVFEFKNKSIIRKNTATAFFGRLTESF